MIAEKINYERIEELPEKKIEKKVQKRSVVNKTSYILVSICFLLSSIFLLKGYSDIQIMRYEINQLQKQKNNLTQQKEDLYVRLEGLKNNQEIGKQAEELLGMSYPDKDQIVYIAVDDSNEINHYGFKDRIKVVIGFFLAHI